MTYFRKRHLISYFGQVRVPVWDLNGLIEEFEKGVFDNPLEGVDADLLIQGLAFDEVKIRQFTVVFGLHQKCIQDHSDNP